MEEFEEVGEVGEVKITKKRKNNKFIIGFVAGICVTSILATAIWFVVSFLPQTKTDLRGSVANSGVRDKMLHLADVIDYYYYDDVDKEKIITGIYKGMFEGLGDPYSTYYTKEEYNDLMMSMNGNYYGIGAVLAQDKATRVVTISKVFKDSPAEKSEIGRAHV